MSLSYTYVFASKLRPFVRAIAPQISSKNVEEWWGSKPVCSCQSPPKYTNAHHHAEFHEGYQICGSKYEYEYFTVSVTVRVINKAFDTTLLGWAK